jgi:hypothetical protein
LGSGGSISKVVGLSNNSYKPITNTAWVRTRFCKLQKGCTRLAATSDKVYQLLAHDQLFSSGTPASSTNTTGRHDIAEILLKEVLNTTNQFKSNKSIICWPLYCHSFDKTAIVPCSLVLNTYDDENI